jgi:hypothetical protein
MGIQINGNTDTIAAIDGALTVSGAELAGTSNINVAGIITATGFVGNVTGNINSTGVSTIATLNVAQSNPTRLNVSGVSTFSGGIVVSAGSTSAPSISPSGDSNTGIFFPAADTIAFAEGGVEALRIDSSANIGIGTISPAGSKLDVRQLSSDGGSGGTALIFNSDDSSQIWRNALKLRHNIDTTIVSGSSIGIGFEPLSSTGSSFYGSAAIKGVRENSTASNQNTALTFWTRSGASNNTTDTEKLRIDSSGRVTMPFQPFAFVARSASVSVANGAKIPFDSVLDSRGLTWNTTNNNFVVPATGVYTFSIYIRLATTSVNYIYAQIRSNGTAVYGGQYLYLQKPNTLDSFQTAGVTISVKLTQNDTVDVIGSWNGGTLTLAESQSLMSIVFNG